jgi:hypothetical protein
LTRFTRLTFIAFFVTRVAAAEVLFAVFAAGFFGATFFAGI